MAQANPMQPAPFEGFSTETVSFLTELAAHNDKGWFLENRHRYEDHVVTPALSFIDAMGQELTRIAPHHRAVPKKSGGSMMRIYRDTRFSKDKTPYKTNLGIQFRHAQAKDAHAPMFYFHIDAEECFIGAGAWHPDTEALGMIRSAIVDDPDGWTAARDDAAQAAVWDFSYGDRLKRPPKGYDADHPLIEDLKRKDYLLLADLPHERTYSPNLPGEVAARYAQAGPLMGFLCGAVGLPC